MVQNRSYTSSNNREFFFPFLADQQFGVSICTFHYLQDYKQTISLFVSSTLKLSYCFLSYWNNWDFGKDITSTTPYTIQIIYTALIINMLSHVICVLCIFENEYIVDKILAVEFNAEWFDLRIKLLTSKLLYFASFLVFKK